MTSQDFREQLLSHLGGPWPEPCDLDVQSGQVVQHNGYSMESLSYAVEPHDRVPAFLLIPDAAAAGKPLPPSITCRIGVCIRCRTPMTPAGRI